MILRQKHHTDWERMTVTVRKTPCLSCWNESFIFINLVFWPQRQKQVLWVWFCDCRKAQEMNVLSARAKKTTRLQRERRNKYLNLTHLLLPSQTKQAVSRPLLQDTIFISSMRSPLIEWPPPHIWNLEWEYSAGLVETVGLDLWCLLSRGRLRLCSTGGEQPVLLTQWKTERGRRCNVLLSSKI